MQVLLENTTIMLYKIVRIAGIIRVAGIIQGQACSRESLIKIRYVLLIDLKQIYNL
jgi:hypothetical protein